MTRKQWSVHVRIAASGVRHVDVDMADEPDSQMILERITCVREIMDEPYRATIAFGDKWIAAQAWVQGGNADDAIAEIKHVLWYAAQDAALGPVLKVLEAHAEPWKES